jgi:hypothetical protein
MHNISLVVYYTTYFIVWSSSTLSDGSQHDMTKKYKHSISTRDGIIEWKNEQPPLPSPHPPPPPPPIGNLTFRGPDVNSPEARGEYSSPPQYRWRFN